MPNSAIKVGLRIDVDTFRGTRLGVPRLLQILSEHRILATFFFSVGPDNMGRHLWRLLKPVFLLKMLRSNAASLYGWDILLQGTFWPGRHIGRGLGGIINEARAAGHEIGLHAWDHHKWQQQVEAMSPQEIRSEVSKGYESLQAIISSRPDCSAAAGWKCTEQVLLQKETFRFRYNSDCRGHSIFRPRVNDRLCAPQIPVTLPTYDELVGRNGINNANYNQSLLDMIRPGRLNVLTIHAEVEGIACAALFDDFLKQAGERNILFAPLGSLLPAKIEDIPPGRIYAGTLPGREGGLCLQAGDESGLS
jgi:undecaprenyl phosphate-alpha-L-ara4FN deformylase